jgi:hypothetical protein
MFKIGIVTAINNDNGNVAVTFLGADDNTTDFIPRLSNCGELSINDSVAVAFSENNRDIVVIGKLEGEK